MSMSKELEKICGVVTHLKHMKLRELLLLKEESWKSRFKETYNRAKHAIGIPGLTMKFSKDHRKLLSQAAMGNKRWEGRKHTNETKILMKEGAIRGWKKRKRRFIQNRDNGKFAKGSTHV